MLEFLMKFVLYSENKDEVVGYFFLGLLDSY